jgi:fibro-slime domain-containing protein
MRKIPITWAAPLGALLMAACSSATTGDNTAFAGPSKEDAATGGGAGSVDIGAGGTNGLVLNIGDADFSPTDAGFVGIMGDGALPSDFTASDKGGFKLGTAASADASAPDPGTNGGGCGSTLVGITRDFMDTHLDFEHVNASGKGTVEITLGADRKPVYAGKKAWTTTQENFDQWYRNVDGINMPYYIYLFFVPNAGVYTFASTSFFPLDGAGFGNQGRDHNFHFTTELHTQFRYNGGETFAFTGDDDLFVFINKKLAIDLGGVHGAQSDKVSLDAKATELGIEKGNVYDLDLFQAERHTSRSNFQVDTNLDFVNCGIIIPTDVK